MTTGTLANKHCLPSATYITTKQENARKNKGYYHPRFKTTSSALKTSLISPTMSGDTDYCDMYLHSAMGVIKAAVAFPFSTMQQPPHYIQHTHYTHHDK